TVYDDIIVLTPNFFRIAGQQGNVFLHRGGKRMMAGIPAVLFLVETQEWELNDPEEIELVRRDRQLALGFQYIGAIELDASDNFAGGKPLIRGKQYQITLFN